MVVLRALGLGDLLTAVPALRAIARAFPDRPPVLVTTPDVAPLAARARLGRVSVAEPLGPLDPSLAGAAVAVNLHGRGPQSHRRLLALGPGRMVAFENRDAGVAGPQWREGEHEVHRWCRLLEESGIPANPSLLGIELPSDMAPLEEEGYTVVHPGASSAARRWPSDRWAGLVRDERARGRTVVITGSPAEIALAHRVAAAALLPDSAVLAGRTSLCDLAALVAAAGRVVCADTGIAHLATALAVPSVVLFGPVPPTEWGPPPERPWHRALWAGRRGDPHGDLVDPGLLDITVADVTAALDSLPEEVRTVSPDGRGGQMTVAPFAPPRGT